MSIIDAIKKELETISPWPWRRTYYGMTSRTAEAPLPGAARDLDFIAKSPERIAALIEYVEAAEKYLERIAPAEGNTMVIHKDTAEALFAARRKLGMEP